MDWVGSSNTGTLEIVLPMMSEHALSRSGTGGADSF